MLKTQREGPAPSLVFQRGQQRWGKATSWTNPAMRFKEMKSLSLKSKHVGAVFLTPSVLTSAKFHLKSARMV